MSPGPTAMSYGGRTEQRTALMKRRMDAERLLDASRWRGAMYMLGYSVECRLKVALMDRYECMTLGDLSQRLEKVTGDAVGLKTHSISMLSELLGLHDRLDRPTRRACSICSAWTTDWRYDPRDGSERECAEFFEAVRLFLNYLERSV